VLVIVASGVFSNVVLSRYESRLGRRFFILLFSGLMVGSGILLFLTTSTALLLLAFFIGNISTTGTEAGPFQSIEAGVLPGLVPPARTNRTFGVYNVLGYGAASIGLWRRRSRATFRTALRPYACFTSSTRSSG